MDQRIAQKIADEVMSGLGYNINVMNAEGVIIGSGSKDRLGSFHETALEVIRCGRVLEVTADQASALQGVREGINLPILDSRKQVIGVVGITGDPECVRNIGKLVKMSAELILSQDESMRRFYQHINEKDFFITALLNETPHISEGEIIALGKRMAYDMGLERIACVFCPLPTLSDEMFLSLIKSSGSHTKQDISQVLKGGGVLVFKTITGVEPWTIEGEVQRYLEGIKECYNGQYSDPIKLYVGNHYPGISGYRQSFDDALTLMKTPFICPQKEIYFTHRELTAVFYESLSQIYKEEVLDAYLGRIKKAFNHGMEDAMITMAYLLENDNIQKTAEQLFVHKNTVLFRKNKLCQAMGLHFKNSPDHIILMRLLIQHYFKGCQKKVKKKVTIKP